MRIWSSLILLAIVSSSQSRSNLKQVQSLPRQFIKQTTILGHNLPQNATQLEVCFKSEENANKSCDIFNTTAWFTATSQKRPDGIIRLFADEIGRAKRNIFAAHDIMLTLKNSSNHSVVTRHLSSEWIEKRVKKDVIYIGILNQSHPNVHDMLGAWYKYEVTGDDSHVRNMILAGLKLEIFCSSGWYGEECLESCPNGCAHGTCSNGTCSNCEHPYHGPACDRCGTHGDCANGVCRADDERIMNGRCVCPPEYEGAQCDVLVNDCTIVPCTPHGKCNLDIKKCVCFDTRFRGNFCEIYTYWGSHHSLIDGSMCLVLLMFLAAVVIRLKLMFMRSTCEDIIVEIQEKFAPEKPEKDYHQELLNKALLHGITHGRETHL